jgi:hypothetical protein
LGLDEEPKMDRSKDSTAIRLAQSHYAIERGIVRILRLLSDPVLEENPKEPIKLLEVNEDTTADGIRPVFFGPHANSEIYYPSVIIEVTPDEFDDIQQNPSTLPNGWRLGEELPRAMTAAAGH